MLFFLAGFVALVIQTTVPRLLPVGILVPDLILILTVDLGLRHQGAVAALIVFAMGYAIDAFSGVALGLNALLLTIIFLLVYWVSRSLIASSTALGVVAVFGGVIFNDYGNYLLSSGLISADRLSRLLPEVLMQAGLTALLAPPVFRLMKRLARLTGLRVRGESG